MACEEVMGEPDKANDLISTLARWKIRSDGLSGNVVRRSRHKFFFSPLPDQQMSIPDTRLKTECLRSDHPVKIEDDLSGLSGRDVTGRKIIHDRVLVVVECDQVATEGDILQRK